MALTSPNRRRFPRVGIRIPVFVKGFDTDGAAWEEMATTDDASSGGVSFHLQHRVAHGQILHLSLALPMHLRWHDDGDASYRIYALIRNVGMGPQEAWVRVKFLGRRPPRGYKENPAGRYLLPTDPPPALAPTERRRYRRLEVFLNLRLHRTNGASGQSEQTIAENIGKGGARVLTSLPVDKGEVVWVEELGGSFRTRAEVKNVYLGKDNVPRLNLQFLDEEAPDRLVAVQE